MASSDFNTAFFCVEMPCRAQSMGGVKPGMNRCRLANRPSHILQGSWTMEWVVAISTAWFAPDRMVYAIAIHWGALLPTPVNLLIPLYCNSDVPAPFSDTPINCSQYDVSSVAQVYGSGTEWWTNTFKSTRTIDPRSSDYEYLSPIRGKIRLEQLQYEIFQSESAYVIMYMQVCGDWNVARGRDPSQQVAVRPHRAPNMDACMRQAQHSSTGFIIAKYIYISRVVVVVVVVAVVVAVGGAIIII